MAVVKLGRPVKSNLGGPNGAMAYIIDPAKTRAMLISALEMLGSKRDSNPPKKHDNLPM